MIGHILFEPVRRFFLGIGGLSRYCIFQFINAAIEEKHPTSIYYYLDNKDEVTDRNGFTTAQKNMFVAFILFISCIILIEKLGQ